MSIPIEEISFTDIYKFPLHQNKYSTWVYDSIGNFVFQFEFFEENREIQNKIISILNGDLLEYNRQNIENKDGVISLINSSEYIKTFKKDLILIRGWGNLTGIGSFNLDGERAAKIQDTFANFITEKLSKNDK